MRFKVVFQAALALGAALAVVGGGALAVLGAIDPDLPSLRRLETGYRHAIFGFAYLSLFAVASVLIDLMAARRDAFPKPETAPAPALPLPAPAPGGRLSSLYHEMKTYIDLEMWELALEKANLVVKDFPGTPEADLVSKNLSELRWKAEPKFAAKQAPLSATQERELKEKGLAQMCQHVKTYMDLEMWELARQKAITIMKNFPESPEANELAKVFETIERKVRETAAAPAPSKL
jgi:hypothetical protein